MWFAQINRNWKFTQTFPQHDMRGKKQLEQPQPTSPLPWKRFPCPNLLNSPVCGWTKANQCHRASDCWLLFHRQVGNLIDGDMSSGQWRQLVPLMQLQRERCQWVFFYRCHLRPRPRPRPRPRSTAAVFVSSNLGGLIYESLVYCFVTMFLRTYLLGRGCDLLIKMLLESELDQVQGIHPFVLKKPTTSKVKCISSRSTTWRYFCSLLLNHG